MIISASQLLLKTFVSNIDFLDKYLFLCFISRVPLVMTIKFSGFDELDK
jgi:hypothetical protein